MALWEPGGVQLVSAQTPLYWKDPDNIEMLS